jgi:Fanconi anemia group M protein
MDPLFTSKLALRDSTMTPREYQLHAASDVVEKGNALVVLPTALGKTFIALLVMARLLYDDPKAKFLFLTPTKPLALQQATRAREVLKISGNPDDAQELIVTLTGETAPSERAKIYQTAQVVFATPQTIENDVLEKRVKLESYRLVVLDEAHRAVGEYAYAFVAQHAQTHAKTLVLGLTASPSSDKKKIDEICQNLRVAHVIVKTADDEDVAPYANAIKLSWEFVDLPPRFKEVHQRLNELLLESLETLRAAGFLFTPPNKTGKGALLELRPRLLSAAQKNPSAYGLMSVHARALNIMHAMELLETQGPVSLLAFLEGLGKKKDASKASKNLAEDARVKMLVKQTRALVDEAVPHPKLVRLRELVTESLARKESVMIFAHYRATVEWIVKDLESIDGCFPGKLVGQAKAGGMNQKKQAQAIQAFREGAANVLVCSSVGEEGLDLPDVELVIFFEAVPSEIRLIQRRGRTGRHHEGKAIVLLMRGTRDEAYFWSSRRKETLLGKRMDHLVKHGPAERVVTLDDFGAKNSVATDEDDDF